MATIQKLTSNKGTVSYKAIVRKSGMKPVSKTFPKKSLATAWSKRIEDDVNLRRALKTRADRIILGDLIQEFMDNWTGKSTSNFSQLRWWKKELGFMKAIEVATDDIRLKLDECKAGTCSRGNGRGANKGKTKKLARPRSAATINIYRSVLSAVYRYGMETYGLPDNPVRNVSSETLNNQRIRYLSETERTALFKACSQSDWDKLGLVVMLAISTGARKSELTGLKWSDIDFKARTATLHDTKNGSPRLLTLPHPAIEALMPFRKIGNELVFPSALKPHQPMEFKKHWAIAKEAAGIKDFRFHDLRHTHASYLALSGAGINDIAESLGHKSYAVTKRYTHLTTEHRQKLTDKVFGGL